MAEPASRPPELRLEIEGPLAWIIADNVTRLNAFTASMWAALPRHIAAAEVADGVRVILLRGAGTKAFSAGADISEFESGRTGDGAKAYDQLNQEAFAALLGASKPVIAVIHGFCLGGGFGIAACCDLRYADAKAQFSLPPAKLGLGYNARWIRPLLALASPAHVKEMLFTGRRFAAADALRVGLVNGTFGEDGLVEGVRAIALEIAGNAPLTIKAAKLAVDEMWRRPETPDTAKLDLAVAACFESEDYAEGRRAFLEKRKPEFKGR